MKMVQCQVCGKEVKKDDIFLLNEKEMCHDCRREYYAVKNAKPCSRCGETTRTDDLITLKDEPVCCNCAFENGKAEYDSFKNAYKSYNEKNLLEYNKKKRKTSLLTFLKVAGVFLLINIAIFVFTAALSGGKTAYTLDFLVFIIAFIYIKGKKVKDYVPLTEEEYYYNIYLNERRLDANTTMPANSSIADNKPESKSKTLSELYQLLETDKTRLASAEIDSLIKDFKSKSKIIELEPNAKYTVEYGIESGFNGLLMINEKNHDIYHFEVSSDSGKKQTIKTYPDVTVYCTNCRLSQIKDEKMPEEPLPQADTTDKLAQLERVEKLFSSGIISQEELSKLKSEILK